MIDLDNWFSGRYRISAPLEPRQEVVKAETGAGGEVGGSNGNE